MTGYGAIDAVIRDRSLLARRPSWPARRVGYVAGPDGIVPVVAGPRSMCGAPPLGDLWCDDWIVLPFVEACAAATAILRGEAG